MKKLILLTILTALLIAACAGPSAYGRVTIKKADGTGYKVEVVARDETATLRVTKPVYDNLTPGTCYRFWCDMPGPFCHADEQLSKMCD